MADKNPKSIFETPTCLVSTTEDGQLQAERETLKQIQKINKPLVVVAICGPYRTGKSYLLNRLANSSNGFLLGKTIEAKTKGIWIWCKEHPLKENTVLVLLDTEGLGDVSKGDGDHDNRIFTMAVLLCNLLLYNMMSAFHQDAVENLTFITTMSKNIRFRNGKESVNEEQLGMILPTFVLCLRDFSLQLAKDDKEITPDDYLEDCLKPKPGNNNTINKFNRPRECIRKYFPKRKCFVFDRPCGRTDLQKLECVPFENLSKEFIEETKMFTEYIYACEAKVLLNSKPINGRMFVTLLETYMTSIREGAVPDVDDAFTTVASIENEQIAAAAVREFAEKIKTIKYPILKTRDFEKFYQQTQRNSLSKFRAETVFNAEKYEQNAITEMNTIWNCIKKENAEKVGEYCEHLIKQRYALSVGTKMQRGDYNKPGGYQIYRLDVDELKRDYWKEVNEYNKHETREAVMRFMEDEDKNEKMILRTDLKITAEEREREIKNILIENKTQQEKMKKEFEAAIENEKVRADQHRQQIEQERVEHLMVQDKKLKCLEMLLEAEKENSRAKIKEICRNNEEMCQQQEKQFYDLQKQHNEAEIMLREYLNIERSKAKEKEQEMKTTLTKLQTEIEEKTWQKKYLKKKLASTEKEYKNKILEADKKHQDKLDELRVELDENKNRQNNLSEKLNIVENKCEELEKETNKKSCLLM